MVPISITVSNLCVVAWKKILEWGLVNMKQLSTQYCNYWRCLFIEIQRSRWFKKDSLENADGKIWRLWWIDVRTYATVKWEIHIQWQFRINYVWFGKSSRVTLLVEAAYMPNQSFLALLTFISLSIAQPCYEVHIIPLKSIVITQAFKKFEYVDRN